MDRDGSRILMDLSIKENSLMTKLLPKTLMNRSYGGIQQKLVSQRMGTALNRLSRTTAGDPQRPQPSIEWMWQREISSMREVDRLSTQ